MPGRLRDRNGWKGRIRRPREAPHAGGRRAESRPGPVQVWLLALASGLLAALPAAPGPAGAEVARADWPLCGSFAFKPNQRFRDRQDCVRRTPVEEVARRYDVVQVGRYDDVVAPAVPVRDPRCGEDATHAAVAGYVEELRAAREAAGLGRQWIVHAGRFDIVAPAFAALPGFRTSFLVRTDTPWARVQSFFRDDASGACRKGCRLLDIAEGQAEAGIPSLPAQLEEKGPEGISERVVYYLSKSRKGRDEMWINAAVADLRVPGYRAFRVREARRAMEAGGYDAVMLNQKFSQLRKPYWLGGKGREDVRRMQRTGGGSWSARPRDYEYADYVAGWSDLGADLREAGVPYAVLVNSAVWTPRGREKWDDPSTPDVDEARRIRETAEGAALVMLSVGRKLPRRQAEQIAEDLRAAGAHVVAVGGACGHRDRGDPASGSGGKKPGAAPAPRGS